MMDIEIRIAMPEDLDTVVDFSHKLFQEDAGQRDPFMNLNWATEHGHDFFRPMIIDDGCLCLLAEVEKKPAGFLIGILKKPSDVRPIHAAELFFVDRQQADDPQKTILAQHHPKNS